MTPEQLAEVNRLAETAAMMSAICVLIGVPLGGDPDTSAIGLAFEGVGDIADRVSKDLARLHDDGRP